MKEFVIQLSEETMQEIRDGMELEDWDDGPATSNTDVIRALFMFDSYRDVVDVRDEVSVAEVINRPNTF